MVNIYTKPYIKMKQKMLYIHNQYKKFTQNIIQFKQKKTLL